jgi:hypothetical protein
VILLPRFLLVAHVFSLHLPIEENVYLFEWGWWCIEADLAG